MACLQYSPAPVVFSQGAQNILWHQFLLDSDAAATSFCAHDLTSPRRKTYNRSDLLGLREKLLSQARDMTVRWRQVRRQPFEWAAESVVRACTWPQVHEALQHGPVEFDKAEIFGATTNTTISSGQQSQLRLGFRVQGSGFRVSGLGFRVSGLGFRGFFREACT